MNKEERNKLYRNAITTYGQRSQMIVAMQECSELIQAITKYFIGRETNLEEIADVEIMLEQLRIMCNETLVEAIKEKKLKRLEQRLNSK